MSKTEEGVKLVGMGPRVSAAIYFQLTGEECRVVISANQATEEKVTLHTECKRTDLLGREQWVPRNMATNDIGHAFWAMIRGGLVEMGTHEAPAIEFRTQLIGISQPNKGS